ncbi:MAG: type III-B CRISPR module RAMP protein Cmr1 [Candidatus Methanoperedens sp.]
MRRFVVNIKPLTPIWTGDAERKNNTLRETGIIGSLRWWYEALIRGLGGTTCDPTQTDCKDDYHCDACELFGCTGWARKFRLEMNFSTTIPELSIGTREKRRVRNNWIYLKRNVAGFMSNGSIALTFIPLREISKNEWSLLNATLKIIGDYGAIGAHTSQGNGIIKIVENNLPEQMHKINFSELKKSDKHVNNSPNLKNYFFYKFHLKFKEDISGIIKKKTFWTHNSDHRDFNDNWNYWETLWKNYHFLPIAFHIRDAARHFEVNRNNRHEIFGVLGNGSKVFVSHGYKIDEKTIEFRVWGYDVDKSLKNNIKNKLNSGLKQKLFSDGNDALEICELKEEKSGEDLLKGIK